MAVNRCWWAFVYSSCIARIRPRRIIPSILRFTIAEKNTCLDSTNIVPIHCSMHDQERRISRRASALDCRDCNANNFSRVSWSEQQCLSKSLRNVAVRRRLCKNLNAREKAFQWHNLPVDRFEKNARSNSIQHVVQLEDTSIIEVTFRRDQIQRSTIQDASLVNEPFSAIESLNVRLIGAAAKEQISLFSYGFQWISIDQIEKNDQMNVKIDFGQRSRSCSRCWRTRYRLLFAVHWCRWMGAFVHFHIHRLERTKEKQWKF